MIIRDGAWTLFDCDIKTGRQVWHLHEDGRDVFRTDMPVDATVDVNKAQRNLVKPGWAGDYHMIASVPMNVYHDQLLTASKQKDDKFISRWLNDSENAAWRTKEGRV